MLCLLGRGVHSLSFLDDIRDEELAGLVGGPDERAAGRVQEAQLVALLLPVGELLRGHVLLHLGGRDRQGVNMIKMHVIIT